VADHPLRSATHRRLGEPLPHQLANAPRVHLKVEVSEEKSFDVSIMRPKHIMRY
jgi:hypothetical protein